MLTVASSTTSASKDQFWCAVDLWLNKPHVINRRLCGAEVVFNGYCDTTTNELPFDFTELQKVPKAEVYGYLSNRGVKPENTSPSVCMSYKNRIPSGLYVVVKELLPRNTTKFQSCLELSIIDTAECQIKIMTLNGNCPGPVISPRFMYQLSYSNNSIILSMEKDHLYSDTSVNWLKDHLLPKIKKWAENSSIGTPDTSLSSLSLISCAHYNELYNDLKSKYSREIIQIWPEVTDPQKFVFEDLAIAAYLLILWEQDRVIRSIDKKQSFVDLGCGNGLLVHILTQEGHPGLGIDVRKRIIWDMYPSTTKLEVRTITPSEESLFPDADWIIGNHTDELTPWVPVIAARSSVSCQFFLLPCCSYNFDGTKYQRRNSSHSQYEDYMKYVRFICESCGFITKMDRLKIPSTKRTCYIGHRQSVTDQEMELLDIKIQQLISPGTSGNDSGNNNYWCSFKPRSNVEAVRNCTQLDKSLCDNLVKMISEILLQKSVTDNLKESDWRVGGTIEIKELANILPSDKLKLLKKEFGGLQTLLRNNHFVFIVSKGTVRHRDPRTAPPKNKWKSKPCWFYNNHPDGCPLTDKLCTYIH